MSAGDVFQAVLEVKPQGAVAGTRALAGATKELTEQTRRSGEESRRAGAASQQLAEAERRRQAAAAEMIRQTKAQNAALQQYQKQVMAATSAEMARANVVRKTQAAQVASTGVDPNSKLGTAMQSLLERNRQLRASIQETAAALVKADQVTGNIAALQARTRAMEQSLVYARQGREAELAYAEAVRKQISATGAQPGTSQAAAVEKEVRAQERLGAELRAVAAARERDRQAAAEAAAQQQRVAGEIAQLREATHQLEVKASAQRRGATAVREANIQLELRNTLLRAGVSAGSADAVVIEQQIRRQAQLRQELDQTTGAKRRTADAAGILRNAFFALQGAIAALGLSALVRDSVQVALAMDRAKKSLFAATGSQSGATREMAFVTAEAERLGLVLTDTAQAYAKLSAASRGTALAGQATRDIFSAISETATILGLRADETKGALNAVQQMISKGAVQSEELRGQLGERLPGAYSIAARAMGLTTAQLQKQLELGKITAADMLPKLAAELRRTFGPGLVNAVNSAQANLNRFRNALDQVKAALGEGFLSGFLAGFADLREAMTAAELRQAARDLGEDIGSALRTAADAAMFLAENLELVKMVLIDILALKAAAWFVSLTSAIAKATGATIIFRTAASNLALAGGLGAVAIALSALIIVMNQYIATSRLALEVELDRVAKSQEVFGYYRQLKANKEGLTEAEWAYAAQVRQTMVAEMAALKVSLARTKAQYEASKTLNPIKYQQVAGPGRNALRQQVAELTAELQTLENQLNILDTEWFRLMKLPVLKLETDDTDLGKTGKKIADLLEGFRRAAEQAERVAVANRDGATEAQRVTDAIERENAAYQALHSLEGLSAGAKAKLAAIIDVLVGRTQAANQATADLIATRERDLAYSTAAREAEARLADARAGDTEASRELAIALEAETIARERNRGEDGAYIKQLTEQLRVRAEYLRSISAEANALEQARSKRQEYAADARRLEAEVADAKAQNTRASVALTDQLEIEQRILDLGTAATLNRILQIYAEVKARRALLDLKQEEISSAAADAEFQRAAAVTRADIDDWKERLAAVGRYGEEVTGILERYGRLNTATQELERHERALAIARANNIDLSSAEGQQRLAEIQATLAGQDAYLQRLRDVQLQHELMAYALQPLRQAWQQLGTAVRAQLVQIVTTGKASWKEMAQQLLATFVDALLQMLARWIATHRAMQAEAARTAAANAAAGNAGAASGGTGGSMGWLIGNPMTSSGGLTGAFSSSGSMGGLAGWGAAYLAVFLIAVNQIKTMGRVLAAGTLEINEAGEAVIRASRAAGGAYGSGRMRQVLDALKGLFDAVKEFAESIGTQLAGMEGMVELGRTGQGKKTNWWVRVVDEQGRAWVQRFGRDMEAAQEYALVQAMRLTTYRGASPVLQAAIRQSTARTVQEFQRAIEPLIEIDRLLRGELRIDIQTSAAHFDELRAALQGVLLPAEQLADALGAITRSEGEYWRALQDQITGRQRTEEEVYQERLRQMEIANRELELRKAELALQIAHIKAQIAFQESLRASTKAFLGAGVALVTGAAGLAPLGGRGNIQMSEEELAALRQQLAALEALLASLPGAIDPASVRRGSGDKPTRGGGGGGTDTLANMLRDYEWEKSLRGMSEYARSVAEIQKKWAEATEGVAANGNALAVAKRRRDEAIRAANGNAEAIRKANEAYERASRSIGRNAEALAAANAARQDELELLRAEAREAHREELKPWLDDFGKSDWDLRLQDLGKQFAEARKRARELGEAVWKVALAEERATKALGREAVASLGLASDQTKAKFEELAGTLNFVRSNAVAFGISAEEMGRITSELGNTLYISLVDSLLKYVTNEEARRDIEELRYQMEIANIKLTFSLVKEMGVLTEAQVRRIQGLIDALPDTVPPAPVVQAWRDIWTEQEELAEQFVQQAKEARELLGRYHSEGLNPYEAARLQIESDFAKIRKALGSTSQVALEHAAALERLRKQYLSGLREFYDALRTGPASGLTTSQQYEAAYAQFQRLQAAVRGGDLSQADALRTAGDNLVGLMQQMFDTSSGGYAALRAQILAAMEDIFANAGTPGGGGSGAPAAATSSDIDRSITATNNVTLAVDYRGMRQEEALDRLGTKLDTLNTTVSRLGATAAPGGGISYGGGQTP